MGDVGVARARGGGAARRGVWGGRRRLLCGLVIAAAGLVLCFALDAFYERTSELGQFGDNSPEIIKNVWVATPFVVLGALTWLSRMSAPAAAVAFLAVAATTAYAYDAAWTTDSSTAGLFLAFQPFQGFLIVVIAFGLDMLFRELPAWRRRRKSESAGR